MSEGKRNFVVYRSSLLPYSETFILNQSESIPGFEPFYMGHRRVKGVITPPERTYIRSGVHERIHRAEFLAGLDRPTNRVLRSRGASLFHAHFGPDAAFALETVRRSDLPLVVTFHGYDVIVPDEHRRGVTEAVWIRRRKSVFRHASALVAVSDFVRNRLLELGAPPHKVIRHYIGVDAEKFRPGGGERDPFSVLFVGRLIPLKGLDHLVRALARVRLTIPQVSLTVAGDGPSRSPSEALCAELGVSARFLGAVPHDRIREEMDRATVFSVPSHTVSTGQAEALGLGFAEAQAMGLPVVAYRSGGVPEVAADQALLADEGDVEGLAERLSLLLSDPAFRVGVAERARSFILQHHNLRTQSQALAEIYQDLAK